MIRSTFFRHFLCLKRQFWQPQSAPRPFPGCLPRESVPSVDDKRDEMPRQRRALWSNYRGGTENWEESVLIIDKPVFRVYDMCKCISRSSAAGFAFGTGGE